MTRQCCGHCFTCKHWDKSQVETTDPAFVAGGLCVNDKLLAFQVHPDSGAPGVGINTFGMFGCVQWEARE